MLEHSSPIKSAADNVRLAPGTGNHSGRRTLPGAAAFWILAGMFLMFFFASAAASPLYPVYQAQFLFSAATLTAVFAVYILVLLVTLLFFGSVSDYLGRLPVIIAALVLSVAGCAAFLAAHDTGALVIARSLQGIAAGIPHRAGHGRSEGPASRCPGLAAAQGHRAAPGAGKLSAAVPCLVATWAFSGLYLSLGPSLAAQETGSPNLLWGGRVIFLLCGTGAGTDFALRDISPARPCWPAACSCSPA